MDHKSAGRAGDPTMATAGLRISAKDDGTWLELQTTGGERALIRMETIADDLTRADGPCRSDGETIKRWCRDQQHARTAGSPREVEGRVVNPPSDLKYERLSQHPASDERDDDVEAMSQDSFPTSDPPSFSGVTRTGGPERGKKR